MNPSAASASVKIAVVCTQASEPRVREIIAFNVPAPKSRDEIPVVAIPTHWRAVRGEGLRRLNKTVPKSMGPVHVLVLDDLISSAEIGPEDDDDRHIIRIPSLTGLVKKLPVYLEAVGLDWLTRAAQDISKWRHGKIDLNHIQRWLHQFSEAGSHDWVGQGLLKVLEFWPEDRLLDVIALTDNTLRQFSWFCMHRTQAGKSADALANLLTKQIKTFNPVFPGIRDFYETLNSTCPTATATSESILFVEDGLFSGTEMTKLFSDLLGEPIPAGRKQKAPPLTDRSALANRQITLLFPVATSLGLARLEGFLGEKGLTNVQVSPCTPGFLDVLTPLGKAAWQNGTFLDTAIRNCPADPDSHLIRLPFENLAIWKTKERVRRALDFCKNIGCQLLQMYLDRVSYRWEKAKVQRCSLGMYGMGLAFAFSHSVPKSTLPLFWSHGKVTFRGRTIDWVPLFPNAE